MDQTHSDELTPAFHHGNPRILLLSGSIALAINHFKKEWRICFNSVEGNMYVDKHYILIALVKALRR